MFLIFMFVVKHNGRASAFRDTTARLRSKRRRHPTIHKTNVRRAVTRRAYRVLGQDLATIGGQICLRNPAVGAGAAEVKAAKVREEYLAAVLEIHASEANGGNQHAHHS